MTTSVAIVASEGFSTFHFSVPLILFGDSVSDCPRFRRAICAETPGLVWSKEGTAVRADADFATLAECEIVVVPFWPDIDERPSPALIEALLSAYRNGATWLGSVLALSPLHGPVYWITIARQPTGSTKKRSSNGFRT